MYEPVMLSGMETVEAPGNSNSLSVFFLGNHCNSEQGSRSPWHNGINSAVTSPHFHVNVNISWPGGPFIPICIQTDATVART